MVPAGARRLAGDDGPEFARAFAQEVRRFYPFAPFVGGMAAERLEWAALRTGRHTPDLHGSPSPYR